MSRFTPGDPTLGPTTDALDLARRSATRRQPVVLNQPSTETTTVTITLNTTSTITGRAITPSADSTLISVIGAPLARRVAEAFSALGY